MTAHSRIPATIVAVRARTGARRAFLICVLCSLAIVASAAAVTDDQSIIPVAILDTFSSISPPAPGFGSSSAGVFTAIIDKDVVTGTSRMDVNVTAGIARCRFTYVRSDGKGTLVLASVCVLKDGHGTWRVEKGTGCYKNFEAVGTETFGPLGPGHAFTNFERFAGIGQYNNNQHGDDDRGGDR